MERIVLDRLSVLDLSGQPVKLADRIADRTLLIFLRHLA
jgi:hypothetical protein